MSNVVWEYNLLANFHPISLFLAVRYQLLALWNQNNERISVYENLIRLWHHAHRFRGNNWYCLWLSTQEMSTQPPLLHQDWVCFFEPPPVQLLERTTVCQPTSVLPDRGGGNCEVGSNGQSFHKNTAPALFPTTNISRLSSLGHSSPRALSDCTPFFMKAMLTDLSEVLFETEETYSPLQPGLGCTVPTSTSLAP